jgi:hypothetical protein
MHSHVTISQRFELRAVIVDAMPLIIEAGAREFIKVAAVSDHDVPRFEDPPIFIGADEPDRRANGIQGHDSGLTASRYAVPGFSRKSEPIQLLLDGLRRTGSIGDEDQRTAFALPLKQPVGRSRV